MIDETRQWILILDATSSRPWPAAVFTQYLVQYRQSETPDPLY